MINSSPHISLKKYIFFNQIRSFKFARRMYKKIQKINLVIVRTHSSSVIYNAVEQHLSTQKSEYNIFYFA